MDYNTLTELLKAFPDLTIEPTSLYRAFAQIPDGRDRRGKRYSLALLLTLILLAKLAGETSLSGVAQWARLRASWLVKVFGLQRSSLPCGGTYSYALAKVQASDVLQAVQHALTGGRAKPGELSRHVALDGKTLGGTVGHAAGHQGQVHLLTLYDVQSGAVQAQCQVQEKQNEISAAPALLKQVQLRGCLVTADALHTQRKYCRQIKAQGADYVLVAKENHLDLTAEIALLFEDPQADRHSFEQAWTLDKGHGRLEKRVITTSGELKDYFAPDWQGIEQVFRLERTITRKGRTSQEIVYGISSLPPSQAGPLDIGQAVRRHWRIENRLHWRRDVTLREDRSQVRTGSAPQVLAVLNSTLLLLMDLLGVGNVPARIRYYQACPWQALRLLVGNPDF